MPGFILLQYCFTKEKDDIFTSSVYEVYLTGSIYGFIDSKSKIDSDWSAEWTNLVTVSPFINQHKNNSRIFFLICPNITLL